MSGVMLAVVIGVGLGLLIGALLFTILLLKNKYVMLLLVYMLYNNWFSKVSTCTSLLRENTVTVLKRIQKGGR